MHQRILAKLSFANVVSVIALFVALSGAAYAGGVKLITGKVVENGSLSGKDIRPNSISSREIKEDKVDGTGNCDDALTPLEVADICYGPVQPAANWSTALKACLGQGLRLPTTGEGVLIAGPAGVQIRNTYNWTADVLDVGAPGNVVAYRSSPDPITAAKPDTDSLPYRCIQIRGDW